MPQSNKKKTIAETLSGKDITLVALGDSNTEINHWTHGELNWLGLLACNYRTCFPEGCAIINSGRSGDTAPGGLARLQKDVLRFSPDLVIIGFGTNDAAISDNLENFKRDMRSIILQLKNVGCEILLRTPPPVVNMNDGSELREIPGQPGSIRDIAAYAKEIINMADEFSCWCVDHYSLWKNSMKSKYGGEIMLLMGNSLHPNGNGHRRFYSEIAPVLGAEPMFQFEWQHLAGMS